MLLKFEEYLTSGLNNTVNPDIVINTDHIITMKETTSMPKYDGDIMVTRYTTITCSNGKEYNVKADLSTIMNDINFYTEHGYSGGKASYI